MPVSRHNGADRKDPHSAGKLTAIIDERGSLVQDKAGLESEDPDVMDAKGASHLHRSGRSRMKVTMTANGVTELSTDTHPSDTTGLSESVEVADESEYVTDVSRKHASLSRSTRKQSKELGMLASAQVLFQSLHLSMYSGKASKAVSIIVLLAVFVLLVALLVLVFFGVKWTTREDQENLLDTVPKNTKTRTSKTEHVAARRIQDDRQGKDGDKRLSRADGSQSVRLFRWSSTKSFSDRMSGRASLPLQTYQRQQSSTETGANPPVNSSSDSTQEREAQRAARPSVRRIQDHRDRRGGKTTTTSMKLERQSSSLQVT